MPYALFLYFLDRGQRFRLITGRTVGITEISGDKWRRLHGGGFLQLWNGGARVSLLEIEPAKLHLWKEERRIELRSSAGFILRLLKLALSSQSHGVINGDGWIKRIKFHGAPAFDDRFVEPALACQSQSELIVGESEIGVELDGSAKFLFCAGPVMFRYQLL